MPLTASKRELEKIVTFTTSGSESLSSISSNPEQLIQILSDFIEIAYKEKPSSLQKINVRAKNTLRLLENMSLENFELRTVLGVESNRTNKIRK